MAFSASQDRRASAAIDPFPPACPQPLRSRGPAFAGTAPGAGCRMANAGLPNGLNSNASTCGGKPIYEPRISRSACCCSRPFSLAITFRIRSARACSALETAERAANALATDLSRRIHHRCTSPAARFGQAALLDDSAGARITASMVAKAHRMTNSCTIPVVQARLPRAPHDVGGIKRMREP